MRPWNRQGSFNKLNRNKRSLVLNLKSPEGRQIFLDLVTESDVVVENFSAGTMDDLGLGYDVLRTARSDIVFVSMPGYGSDGPYRDYVAYGPSIEPKSGLPRFLGYGDGQPHATGLALPDATAGTTAAAAILIALTRRRLTGVGSHVDLSQHEAFIGFMAGPLRSFQLDQDYAPIHSNRSRSSAPSGVFPCAGDDAWIAIDVTEDPQWATLRELVAEPWAASPELNDVGGRLTHHDEVEQRLAAWTRGHQAESLARLLAESGIPAANVATARDLLADVHLNAREFFVTLDHPDVGPKPYPGSPVLINGTRHQGWRAAPTLGEHNTEVLTRVLGRSEEDVATLVERRVITDEPPTG